MAHKLNTGPPLRSCPRPPIRAPVFSPSPSLPRTRRLRPRRINTTARCAPSAPTVARTRPPERIARAHPITRAHPVAGHPAYDRLRGHVQLARVVLHRARLGSTRARQTLTSAELEHVSPPTDARRSTMPAPTRPLSSIHAGALTATPPSPAHSSHLHQPQHFNPRTHRIHIRVDADLVFMLASNPHAPDVRPMLTRTPRSRRSWSPVSL
jgi:hypothetical protein